MKMIEKFNIGDLMYDHVIRDNNNNNNNYNLLYTMEKKKKKKEKKKKEILKTENFLDFSSIKNPMTKKSNEVQYEARKKYKNTKNN